MPRRLQVAFCRLRIGHTRVTHRYLMERSPAPYCNDCVVPQTVRHILVECPSLGDLRARYLSRYRDGRGRYRLSLVLGTSACTMTGGLIDFLGEAGLLPFI